jgi:rare lipoprotein A
MLRLSRLFWVVLLACAFLALDGDRAEAKVGLASWYGPGFEGLPTASGEPYDPYGYTAAHKRMPLGTDLLVSYRGNSVQVTVNDRGPYVGGRKLDLSQGAAEAIGLTRAGVDYVDYSVVGRGYDAGYSDYSRADYAAEKDYSAYSETESYSSGAQMGAGGGTYVVQPGDTLSGIAAQLGTTVEDLAAANGIADPDLIYAGQKLYY